MLRPPPVLAQLDKMQILYGPRFETSDVQLVNAVGVRQDSDPDRPANPVRSSNLTYGAEPSEEPEPTTENPADAQPPLANPLQLDELSDPFAEDYFGLAALAFGDTTASSSDLSSTTTDSSGGSGVTSTSSTSSATTDSAT